MSRAARRHPRLLLVIPAAALVAANLAPSGSGEPLGPSGTPAAQATVDAWLDGQLRDAGIPGAALVVVRDGRIVEERGFGVADDSGRPVTAATPFMLGSLSKSFTALAVMQLVDSGRVDLDAPVARYLPGFRQADSTQGAAVTVRELLTHTSGISTAAGIAPLSSLATTLAGQVADLASVRPVSAPGARFEYSNANYLVLGRLVEVVSGQPFGSYVAAHIFEPLGMDDAATDLAAAIRNGLGDAHRLFFGIPDAHRPAFRPDLVPAGWISASADDMGRYLLAQLDQGNASAVSSSTSLAVMHDGSVPTGVADERAGMGWMDATWTGSGSSRTREAPRTWPRSRSWSRDGAWAWRSCSTRRARSTSCSTSPMRSAWA